MTYQTFNYRFQSGQKPEPSDPRRHKARIKREMFSGDAISQKQADRDWYEAERNESFRHCHIGRITNKQGMPA